MRPESTACSNSPTIPSRASAALEALRRQLTARLTRGDALATFSEARLRHPDALSGYSTPVAAVENLLLLTAGRDNEQVKRANAILRAIVLEYQSTSRDTWSAALILATGPAIRRFAWLARARRLEPIELVQRIVESLLLVAREHAAASEDTYLPFYLRREMIRHAFEELERGRKDRLRTHAAVGEALERRRIEPFVDGRDEATADPVDEVVARETRERAMHAFGPAAFEVMQMEAPSLRSLTRAARPDLSKRQQEHLYQRVKRWQSRARAFGMDPGELTPWWQVLGGNGTKERSES